MSLLILCRAEVEPHGDALVDGTELFTLSMLSLLQLGCESTQLLFPVVSNLHDDIQIPCVLQQDFHCQSVIEPPAIFFNLWRLVFLPGAMQKMKQEVHCYL